MSAAEIWIRFFIQAGIVAIGCCVFIATSQSPQAVLVLLLPLLLGIPATIVVFAIFVPIEAAAAKRGARWLSLILIPIIGVAVPWLLFPLAGNWNNFVQGNEGLSAIGFVWGLLWVITRPIYATFATASRRDTQTQ